MSQKCIFLREKTHWFWIKPIFLLVLASIFFLRFFVSSSFNGASIPAEQPHPHPHFCNKSSFMAVLKHLQMLLLMAPLLLPSQANSIFDRTDTGTFDLPQQTTHGGLSSSQTFRPQPRNTSNAVFSLHRDELSEKVAVRRFRSHSRSMRKRRRRGRRRAYRHSEGFIPAVSLSYICFAILSSILHILVSVNTFWRWRWNLPVIFFH